jgi:hypothetical protein
MQKLRDEKLEYYTMAQITWHVIYHRKGLTESIPKQLESS